MEKGTQTNTTDIEYISIYDNKPKKPAGQEDPKGVNIQMKKKQNGQEYLQWNIIITILKKKERARINKAKKKND